MASSELYAHHPIFVTTHTLYTLVAYAHLSYFAVISFSTWWQYCSRPLFHSRKHGWSFLEHMYGLRSRTTSNGVYFERLRVNVYTLAYAYKNKVYLGLYHDCYSRSFMLGGWLPLESTSRRRVIQHPFELHHKRPLWDSVHVDQEVCRTNRFDSSTNNIRSWSFN